MRQIILNEFPDKNGLFTVSGDIFNHLRKVLRCDCGDMINVRLPDENLISATICKVDDKTKIITLQKCDVDNRLLSGRRNDLDGVSPVHCLNSATVEQRPKTPLYYLFQFIAKPQKMELIVRQATECGVFRIVPVIGEFSQKSNILAMKSESKKLRFEKIIKEAREQSGSAVDTKLMEAVPLNEAIAFWKSEGGGEGFVLWERQSSAIRWQSAVTGSGQEDLSSQGGVDSYGDSRLAMTGSQGGCHCHGTSSLAMTEKRQALVVGCEGGIDSKEISSLTDAGFQVVHFSTNILRCETAALYGMAWMQTRKL